MQEQGRGMRQRRSVRKVPHQVAAMMILSGEADTEILTDRGADPISTGQPASPMNHASSCEFHRLLRLRKHPLKRAATLHRSRGELFQALAQQLLGALLRQGE